ncbi:MAG: SAM-dependent methyltransferase [Bryobacteraceae bacterium]|nr:SAM-dependent methyltransferase [Bryobacteraceae bacterium]
MTFQAVGTVRSARVALEDDYWGDVIAEIHLDTSRFTPDALLGLEAFSHAEIVFVFHQVTEEDIVTGARHPRGRREWPRTGIFAQRGKGRPNRIGLSCCELAGVSGTVLRVRGLDAVDGTPVLDIKPYLREFGPRGEVRQPDWATELMKDYFRGEA